MPSALERLRAIGQSTPASHGNALARLRSMQETAPPLAVPARRGALSFDEMAQRQIEQGVKSLRQEPALIEALRGFPLLPTPEGRAFLSESAQAVPQMIGDVARQQAGITQTHYRNLAQLPGAPFAGQIAEPTPEQQAAYQQAVLEAALTIGGGAVGRSLGTKAADVVKFLGRGFKSVPKATGFIADNPVRAAAASGQGVRVRDLINPAVSGTAAGAIVDAMDPTPYEFTDAPVAGGAGVVTAAGVGKNAVEDLLLGNPRWRDVMMRPSAGTASALLGALLGYLGARGIAATDELINDAANYVASLFSEEPAQ